MQKETLNKISKALGITVVSLTTIVAFYSAIYDNPLNLSWQQGLLYSGMLIAFGLFLIFAPKLNKKLEAAKQEQKTEEVAYA